MNPFGFFNNLQPQTLQQALPRSIAPITAAFGFKNGIMGAAFIAAFVGAFGSDSQNTKTFTLYAVMGSFIGAGGFIGGSLGYGMGYGGSNLFMAAFPAFKNSQFSYLLPLGVKPQACTFLGTLTALVLPTVIKEISHSSSFRP